MPPLKQDHLKGRAFWRSLEQWANSPEYRQHAEQEFVGYDPEGLVSGERRHFMKIMGASMALAGLTLSGCRRWPEEKLAPYAARPETLVPGTTKRYASMMSLSGVAFPLLVTAFDERPIKIEGNPDHPASGGASDSLAQASILELYEPQRSRGLIRHDAQGKPSRSDWGPFMTFAQRAFDPASGGQGIAVLGEADHGLAMADMKRRFLERFPEASWHTYEPVNGDAEAAGSRIAFGQAMRAQWDLSKADVLAVFDEGLFHEHPDRIRLSRQWADRRRGADQGTMNRVYVAEPQHTTTGSVADHRLPVAPSRVGLMLRHLASMVGLNVSTAGELTSDEQRFVTALAKDLRDHAGRSLVVVGRRQPAAVQALGHAINERIRAVGQTVGYIADPAGDGPGMAEQLADLTQKIDAGEVQTLLILGGNPVYDAPADVDFRAAVSKVPDSVHLSLYYSNETSVSCTWHLPAAHYLEVWQDGPAWDGSHLVGQPLLRPLFDVNRSATEVLSMLCEDTPQASDTIVRRALAEVGVFQRREGFEKAWRRVVHDGFVADSAPAWQSPEVARSAVIQAAHELPVPSLDGGLEAMFVPGSTYDGRFANNGWLQEVPDPMTHCTWDNPAMISLADARSRGAKNGDLVDLETEDGTKLRMPVYLMPGQAPGTVVLPLGFGRRVCGNVGEEVGFNTYRLRTTQHPHQRPLTAVRATGGRHDLALTIDHHAIDEVGFEARSQRADYLVKQATLEEYRENPGFVHGGHHVMQLPLWEAPVEGTEHQWGMAIDLNACIGCNACVVACQAENNIPIVGKAMVQMSREMHWLRIDTYFSGEPDDPSPEAVHQPLACVHCENAPCEQVCPVAATVHDTEGLNVMVYNRCIGTRYCSNNCPYKVRRFNYFDYHVRDPRNDGNTPPFLGMPDQQQNQIDPVKRMVYNPEVTVRMRGVMEKCTYCTQRIQEAKHEAKNGFAKGESETQVVQDGAITPACAQTCPTQAIVFGNLKDPESRVAKLHQNQRAYGVLDGHLNTKPRTKHLAKISNPNPALPKPKGESKQEAHEEQAHDGHAHG